LGVTEDTDALAVVVSEESGLISVVQKGEIRRGLDAPKLRAAITAGLEIPRKREKPKPQENMEEPDADTEEVASI
jgi:diadenylate cyclase